MDLPPVPRFARSFAAVALVILTAVSGRIGAEPPAAAPIDFDRQIRPILSENCFACHGPDDKQRKAKLRLDVRDGAVKSPTIVPGKAAESELFQRVTAADPKQHMPPAKSGKRLTSQQIDLLRQWIDDGAKWSIHWAFRPPERPALPVVADKDWPRSPIDYFIAARLQQEGLRPSAEADKVTLIRRLYLDLTGLPAPPAAVDAFLADDRPQAYERLVDRLLASPRYGERMALDWLDAARFADTHGYHIDSGRDMGRWREWVIDAFNNNKPFDRFTIEQLAGDLLPNATLAQRIASGFNRNHMINFEGGAIPEEYHTAYIVDRVNTTGTVWLGLTIGCAQCHDHKFDPITQKEYYQLFAFFHNVPENGLDGSRGNAAPVLKVPTLPQQKRLDELAAGIKQLEQRLAGPMPELAAAQAAWEKTAATDKPVAWTPLEPTDLKSRGGATLTRLADQSIRAGGANPATETYTIVAPAALPTVTALRLEILPDEGLVAKGPGRSVNGNIVLTNVQVSGVQPVKLKNASADFSQQDFPVAHAIDDNPHSGWAIFPEIGKAHGAVFELAQPMPLGRQALLTVTLDFQSQFPQHQPGRFRLSVTDAPKPHGADAMPAAIRTILVVEPARRTDAQRTELQKYYRTHFAPLVKQLNDQLARLRKTYAEAEAKVPTTMVMQEMPQPRDTFLLIRGQYDKHGAKVTVGVPASLPPLPAGSPGNRLGLARWLVDPAQPLTARVIVNRYWQMYFGTGLVKTAEDFGVQGEYPSHSELLDWLATEFVRTGWDIKAMQRLIVTSATYRQASAVTAERLAKDPENRLLARAPRLRLPAEFIRDQALAISGLLNGAIGGSSVSPYQPPGLWEELASRADGANWTAQTYAQSHGKDLYRRTMYTFWKRTSPPPTLAAFDAPDREVCTVRRARTNTPLQALILMNDPTYVETSRKLAERLMTQATSVEERITLAFRLATGRRPTTEELAVLRKIFEAQLAVYRKEGKAALKLLEVGESKRNEKLDQAELAAWAMVASVILNLDETVTRG
jgi:hypothetical protein